MTRRIQKIILEGSDTETRVQCIRVLCGMLDVFDKDETQTMLLNTYKQGPFWCLIWPTRTTLPALCRARMWGRWSTRAEIISRTPS